MPKCTTRPYYQIIYKSTAQYAELFWRNLSDKTRTDGQYEIVSFRNQRLDRFRHGLNEANVITSVIENQSKPHSKNRTLDLGVKLDVDISTRCNASFFTVHIIFGKKEYYSYP